VVALATLITLFVVDEEYRNVVIGAALWYAAGLVYFAVYARRRLVYSPEEAFAEKGPREEPQP
jgi:ethanolamine permease